MGKGDLLERRGLFRAGFYKQGGIGGKRRDDIQNLDELLLLHPELALNGGVICGSPEVPFRLVFIERKLGIRVVYLKFEGFGC